MAQEITRNNEYQLVWSDEFNYSGAPDDRFWSHEIMKYPPNDELEYYVDSRKNSIVEDGMLKIRAVKEVLEERNYTSARIVSRNKVDWKYGRVEVRAKLPAGTGTWPAIWMMYTKDLYGGWPSSGEIDIMEHVGKDPNYVHATIHTKAYNHVNNTQIGKAYYLPDAEKAYHVYSCEWNEDSVKVFVDNNHYFTFKNDRKGKFETWPYNHDFYLILNIAIGGGWGGAVDNTIFKNDTSVQMLIDYVRLYKKASDFSITGPAQLIEKTEATYSVPAYNGSHNFEWIVPQGVEAITKLDSNVVNVKWGCQTDTLKLKVTSAGDTSVNSFIVSTKEPKIKGKLWVAENAENVIYSVDSLPGATFKWYAGEGITFPAGDSFSKVKVSFAQEGTLYVEVTTACKTRKDSIKIGFGTGQFPYPDANKPATIPGKITAAYFDQGGPSIAYKDNDVDNQGKALRLDEQVDVESFDNTYTVGWFDRGEWLKYTVEVTETNTYTAIFRVASGSTTGGKFDILIDDVVIGTGTVSNTGDWNKFTNLNVYNLNLNEGKHVLTIKSYGGFNLGTMTFSIQTDIVRLSTNEVSIFPNPASDIIQIKAGSNSKLKVVGMDGRTYHESVVNDSLSLKVKDWPRGVYTALITIDNITQTHKIVIK